MDLSSLSLSLPDPLDAWYNHPQSSLPPTTAWPYSHPSQYAPVHPSWPMHWRYPPPQPVAGPSSIKPTQMWQASYPPTLLPPQPPQLHALHIPDYLSVPELDLSSPSAPNSPTSTDDAPPTPSPEFVHVVCNAPLVAPKPVVYRPSAVLQFQFELPDPDEDLSHPPYTATRSKRKRTREEHDDGQPSGRTYTKRRATETALRDLNPPSLASVRRFSTSS
ncbi:hypothetical protein EW146_g985 [Bondarzewia mesenterica]|uniref:Uncharacterized protein n=1 Tax=Bondarzewia mesenterica TaxID=1095465 RepID=A0A4S4M7H2_9AGAM|nr:hypothetical protein EW146_g985 [Bondarzewia mesenterica]